MKTGIFPGRFQPFHTGQLLVVKGMLMACDRVVIVGTDPAHVENSEFSKEEIQEMITAALLAEDILDAEIVFVENHGADGEWVDAVIEAAGQPESPQIWSGNEEVLAAFEAEDIETKRISLVPGHDSDEIRGWIQSGEKSWMAKVPSGTVDVIAKHLGM